MSFVRRDLARDPRSQKLIQKDLDQLLKKHPKFQILSEDTFNVVADWYYFAILELTSLKNFRSDPRWIARRLNVPTGEIDAAIARLKRVGLLVEMDGRLKRVERNCIFENIPSAAIRRHHHQTLDLAHSALDHQPMTEREYFTVAMPMDPTLVPRAKTAIREFSENLMAEMQESQPKSVYKLAVQFFRLDKETT